MLRIKTTLLGMVTAIALTVVAPQAAEAGPLLDWLRGRRGCRKPACNTCAAPALAAAPNAYGLQPGQCMKTCQQTCSRVVVNYVPQTAYRTNWKQVPVTQYKPVTNSDPCTGCTTTCMKPCTTYTYQCQRVPYTTYRPVYRTETYKVPVTTITNDCATGNCGGCSTGTCASGTCGGAAPVANYAPTPTYAAPQSNVTYGPSTTYTQPATTYGAPSGSLSTGSNFQASPNAATPADISPSLDSVNPQGANYGRPVLDQINAQAIQSPQRDAPSVMSVAERISNKVVRRQFAYSPARFASHRTVAEDVRDADVEPATTYRGSFKPVQRTTTKTNNGWETVK